MRRSTLVAAFIVAMTTGVVGCAAPTARSGASSSINVNLLDGRWELDRQASDDVRKRLLPLFEKNELKWSRRAARYDFDEPGSLPETDGNRNAPNFEAHDDGLSTMLWIQRERRKEIEGLIAWLSPATQLEIGTVQRSIRIATNKGEGARTVTPGEGSSLFLPVGGFIVSSVLKPDGLQVDFRGTGDNKLQLVEHFVLLNDGTQLEKRTIAKIPGIGKHAFRAIYKRT